MQEKLWGEGKLHRPPFDYYPLISKLDFPHLDEE